MTVEQLKVALAAATQRADQAEAALTAVKQELKKAMNMAWHNYRCAVHEQLNATHHGHEPSKDYPPVVDDEYAALEAALTAVRQAQGWQPIETAPKDAGQLLGWFDVSRDANSLHVMHWDADRYASKPRPHWSVYGWIWGMRTLRACQPKHWMPLPDPPCAPVGGRGSEDQNKSTKTI